MTESPLLTHTTEAPLGRDCGAVGGLQEVADSQRGDRSSVFHP